MDLVIRPARAGDVPAIASLLAPEVASGAVLARSVQPHAFLVAERGDRVVGCVALRPWSSRVVELGSLVAGTRGEGIGSALVEAAVLRAGELGFDTVATLASGPAFFARAGFAAQEDAPWSRARGMAAVSTVGGRELDRAVANQARRNCAACPRLASCQQVLLTRRAPPAVRRAVA